MDPGWCGVSLSVSGDGSSSSSTELVASARQLARDVTVHDQEGRRVRVWRTVQCPTALTWLPEVDQAPGHQMVAVAEGHLLSVWDLRVGEQQGLVQRLAVTPGTATYSLAWCAAAAGGLLGAAGDDRTVSMIDPRKWCISSKWANCTKYSTRYLSFSVSNPAYCFVAGIDYEVLCGRWDGHGGGPVSGNSNSQQGGGHGRAVGPADHQISAPGPAPAAAAAAAAADVSAGCLSFRGDSRWLGVTRATGQDTIAAFSQQGQLYVADFTTHRGLAT